MTNMEKRMRIESTLPFDVTCTSLEATSVAWCNMHSAVRFDLRSASMYFFHAQEKKGNIVGKA